MKGTIKMQVQNIKMTTMNNRQQMNNQLPMNSQPNFGAFSTRLARIIQEDLSALDNKTVAESLIKWYDNLIELAKQNVDVHIHGKRTVGKAISVYLVNADPSKGLLSGYENCNSVTDAADILANLVRRAERTASGFQYDGVGHMKPEEREALFANMMKNSVDLD